MGKPPPPLFDLICLASIIGVFIIFIVAVFPLGDKNTPAMNRWCQDVLMSCGFNAPEIHVMRGKKNVTKCRNGVVYMYVDKRLRDERQIKKALGYLMAFTTTDKYAKDFQYHTNLDVILCEIEKREGFDRREVSCL